MVRSNLSVEQLLHYKGKVNSLERIYVKKGSSQVKPEMRRIGVLLKCILLFGRKRATQAGQIQVKHYINELNMLENFVICVIHQLPINLE